MGGSTPGGGAQKRATTPLLTFAIYRPVHGKGPMCKKAVLARGFLPEVGISGRCPPGIPLQNISMAIMCVLPS